jgi:hypothetical protein
MNVLPESKHNQERDIRIVNTITAVDLDLKNMLREEINKLREYEKMLGSMTVEEKEELREWMAHGRSANSNPYLFYGENGCLLDLITAGRIADDMLHNPEDNGIDFDREPCADVKWNENDELTF